MKTPALVAAAVLGAALLGCGDGLLDAGYRGEPLFHFEGRVATDGSPLTATGPLRAGVFWLPYDPTTLDAAFAERTPIERLERLPGLAPGAALVEQDAIRVAVTFPGVFAINLFAPPPAGLGPVRYAVVLLYADADGNGRMGPGERVGGATSTLLMHAARALPADAAQNPLGEPIAPGYAALHLPLRCGAPPPDDAIDPVYGVRIGARCAPANAAADCGPGGACLLADLDGPLPGGYCVLPHEAIAPGEVAPPSMVLIETEHDGEELRAWYRACEASADCRDGYTCQEHVCLPADAPTLRLDPTAEIEAACAAFHEIERRERDG